MKTFLLLLLLLFTKISHSQYFDWAINLKNQITANNDLYARDLAIDNSNAIYVVLGNQGIAKFDTDSNLLWQNTYPDFSARYIRYKNNKIYITGEYFTDHSMIYCLDTSGGMIWSHIFLDAKIKEIAIDENENVILTGSFSGTATFDLGVTLTVFGDPVFDYDAYVAKLANNGNFLWVKQIYGSLNNKQESGYSITSDNANNIYITGKCYIDTLFIGNQSTYINSQLSLSNIYLIKFDPYGNMIWGKIMGGNSSDWPIKILSNKKDKIFLTGLTNGISTLDTINFTNTGFNRFVISFDTSGLSEKLFQPLSGYLDYYSLVQAGESDILISGSFSDTVKIQLLNGNQINITDSLGIGKLIIHLDDLLNVIWIQNISSTGLPTLFLNYNINTGTGAICGSLGNMTELYFSSNQGIITVSNNTSGIGYYSYLAKFTDTTFVPTSVPAIPFKDENKLFIISPNPTSGEINITTKEEKYEVKISDLNGKKLLSKKLSDSATLDLSAVRAKTVVVEIYVKGKKVQAEKIVIQ